MVWGSHPIGPDKMPSLTPFFPSMSFFPLAARRWPSGSINAHILLQLPDSSFLFNIFIRACHFQH